MVPANNGAGNPTDELEREDYVPTEVEISNEDFDGSGDGTEIDVKAQAEADPGDVKPEVKDGIEQRRVPFSRNGGANCGFNGEAGSPNEERRR